MQGNTTNQIRLAEKSHVFLGVMQLPPAAERKRLEDMPANATKPDAGREGATGRVSFKVSLGKFQQQKCLRTGFCKHIASHIVRRGLSGTSGPKLLTYMGFVKTLYTGTPPTMIDCQSLWFPKT